MEPWRRAVRWAGRGLAVLAPLAAGATWAGVRTLTDSPRPRRRRPDVRARFVDERRVLLGGERAHDAGTWGLAFDGGHVRVGEVLATVEAAALRPYELLDGTAPHAAVQADRRRRDRRHDGPAPADGERRRRRGDRRRRQLPRPWPVDAVVTPYAWPDDPQVLADRTGAVLHLDAVRSGGRLLPSWRLVPDEPSTTWVVAVHGRGSPRTELFRIAAVALASGNPVVVASYRTDAWTASPAPLTTLGTVEWHDVEAAVATALSAGATRVVLAGCSLGGALVAATVRHSVLRDRVAGVVLDAPALSWHPLLRHAVANRGIPTAVVGPVMAVARLRARIDWSALDHLAAVDDFRHPILLLHGAHDDVVPVVLSDLFAAARPDLVTYERFAHAEHVTSWNLEPGRYEAALARFLTAVSDTGRT